MALISEKSHIEKLKKKRINIVTKYIVGNKIVEKDFQKIDDDIKDGIRCEKEYYLNNKLLHQETLFDSRIEYTFLNNTDEEYTCDNCGMHGKTNNFINGFPYCGTKIEYLGEWILENDD